MGNSEIVESDDEKIMCINMVNTNPRRAKPRFAGKVNFDKTASFSTDCCLFQGSCLNNDLCSF